MRTLIALLQKSGTTDSPASAKSAEFLSSFRPRPAACALLQLTAGFTWAAGVVLVSLVPVARAQTTRTANDGVYSEAQAARGRTLYQEKCAKCHGDTLQGRTAPPLTGESFLGVWGTQPL